MKRMILEYPWRDLSQFLAMQAFGNFVLLFRASLDEYVKQQISFELICGELQSCCQFKLSKIWVYRLPTKTTFSHQQQPPTLSNHIKMLYWSNWKWIHESCSACKAGSDNVPSHTPLVQGPWVKSMESEVGVTMHTCQGGGAIMVIVMCSWRGWCF